MLYAYDNVCQCNETTVDVQFQCPYNHEEADTRVFLHVMDMAQNGSIKIAIRTVDTDVLILDISFFHELKVDVDELWVEFGAGKNRCFFRVHEMTGCDQVSFLSHVTKLSAWKVWELFDDVTSVFVKLRNQPSLNEVKDAMPTLERFTVQLYSRSSNALTANECRRELSCQVRAIDNIPPNGNMCSEQHIMQATYGISLWWQFKYCHRQRNGVGSMTVAN